MTRSFMTPADFDRVIRGGVPIVRRFVIRRHYVARNYEYPWTMRDRLRPSWLGRYRTFAEAIEAASTSLRRFDQGPRS